MWMEHNEAMSSFRDILLEGALFTMLLKFLLAGSASFILLEVAQFKMFLAFSSATSKTFSAT